MTASAKSVKGSTQSIDYLIEEHKGYELDRNLIYGDTSVEIMQSFRVQQMANTECEKKFFTAYISPDPKDGQKLTDIELKEISKDFMREIGVNPEKQAFLAVVHTEKNHKHIHLLINRIDEKNKAIKDNFSVLKAQNAAHKIATEKGLISARNVMNKKLEKVIEKDKETKAKILEAHAQVMKIKPQSISKYVEYMKSLGYEIKPTINKNEKLQGFRVKDIKSGQEYKLSEVKRAISQEVQKLKFDINIERSSSKILNTHRQVMQLKPQNLQKYKDYMRSSGYDVNIIKNNAGKIKNLMVNEVKSTAGIFTKEGLSFISDFGKNVISAEPKNTVENSKQSEFQLDIEIRQIMTKQIEEFEKLNDLNKGKEEKKGLNIN